MKKKLLSRVGFLKRHYFFAQTRAKTKVGNESYNHKSTRKFMKKSDLLITDSTFIFTLAKITYSDSP